MIPQPLDTCRWPGCIEVATVYDGPSGWCFDHAEIMIDRFLAIDISPALRELLPAPGDE